MPKRGPGTFGEYVMKGSAIGWRTLRIGAATGGTALLATKTVGRIFQGRANDDDRRAAASGD